MVDASGGARDVGDGFLDLLLGLISLSERMLASSAGLAVPAAPPPAEAPERPPAPAGPVLR